MTSSARLSPTRWAPALETDRVQVVTDLQGPLVPATTDFIDIVLAVLFVSRRRGHVGDQHCGRFGTPRHRAEGHGVRMVVTDDTRSFVVGTTHKFIDSKGFVHENIAPTSKVFNLVTDPGVARDHDRAIRSLHLVGHRRIDRMMMH